MRDVWKIKNQAVEVCFFLPKESAELIYGNNLDQVTNTPDFGKTRLIAGAIVLGLGFAILLTLIFIPVRYAKFFKVYTPSTEG